MKIIRTYILHAFMIIPSYVVCTQIYIVLTTALVPANYELRKQQYLESLMLLKKHGYPNPYIIEAVSKRGPTFFDDYSTNVFYATINNPAAKYQGTNECKTLLEGLHHLNFDPDDMIIKLTGRYQMVSDEFFKIVANNLDYDAIVKKFNYDRGVFSSCFAMKCKNLIAMLEDFDYNAMENQASSFEWEIEKYLKKTSLNILYINNLGIKAVMQGSTTATPTICKKIWVF